MITAAGQTGDGSPLAFLGLSRENLDRLAAGQPIRVSATRMQHLGLPAVEVIIHFGETEDAIIAELGAAGVKLDGKEGSTQ